MGSPDLSSLWFERLEQRLAQLRFSIFFVRGVPARCCSDASVWTCACTWLLLCAEFGPLPQPNQPCCDWILLHTDSLTVSEHARKASVPGVAQFGSYSLCQGLSHDECSMNGASGHRIVASGACHVLREFGYTLSRRHTSWPEKMGTTPCVCRTPQVGKGTALHVSRVPNWTPRVRL